MSKGVISKIEKNVESLDDLIDILKDKIKILNLSDINEIREYPIFQSILVYTKDLQEKIKSYSVEGFDVHQACKDLVTLDINSIFDKERNKILELLNIGKVYIKGSNIINETDEIYYGSSSGLSTYTASEDFYNNRVYKSFDNVLEKLEKVSNNEYAEEVKPASTYTLDA